MAILALVSVGTAAAHSLAVQRGAAASQRAAAATAAHHLIITWSLEGVDTAVNDQGTTEEPGLFMWERRARSYAVGDEELALVQLCLREDQSGSSTECIVQYSWLRRELPETERP